MGSYDVIKEALLVKSNSGKSVNARAVNTYSVVQKIVPATVNGMVKLNQDGGFESDGTKVTVSSVYHGGAFGFSEGSGGDITVTVNIPGYGVKDFYGNARVQSVPGVGQGVLCTPRDSDPSAPYTHLCLVVESPGSVFAEN